MDDWVSVRLQKKLVAEIDQFIASPKGKSYGVRRYHTKPDFITIACIKLLEEETGTKRKLEEVEA